MTVPAADLAQVLSRSRIEGHLGPGSIDDYIAHGRAQLSAAVPPEGSRWLDLGSGGGLPGLVWAVDRPDLELTLLDRSQTRTDFLRWAVGALGVARVEVVTADASDFARREARRGAFDGVVSRSFGRPALVAEVSAALLTVGGRLVVSEPPVPEGSVAEMLRTRWSSEVLGTLGFSPAVRTGTEPSFAVMTLHLLPVDRVPRRWSQMTKKPLF